MRVWKQPLYSQIEVARLSGLSPSRISRWARAGGRSEPWLPGVDQVDGYTFAHLLEVRIIRELLELRLSLRTIRSAYEELTRLTGEFPFARNKLSVLGKIPVWTRFAQELGTGGQLLFDQLVLEFGREVRWSGEIPLEWHPAENVTVDPARTFGAPTVPQGIPTRILHDCWTAEGEDTDRVAWWFDVKPCDVESAVTWERTIRDRFRRTKKAA